jgi:hypothetical protein
MPWSKDTASGRTCIAKSREEPLATLQNVSIDIAVVLGKGKTSMPIHQVLRLGRGAIIELDSSEPDEVRILANNLPVTKRLRHHERQPHRGRGERREDTSASGPCPCPQTGDLLNPQRTPSKARSPHMRSWRNW